MPIHHNETIAILIRSNQVTSLLTRNEQCNSFEVADHELVEELRSVYNDDIESVDLMAGLFAEKPPPGFGFSDTAFRIFAVMAPRRLKSDRFITDSYGADAYTASGIEWVENNDFRSVLLRHMPDLAPALGEGANPFAPWRKANE